MDVASHKRRFPSILTVLGIPLATGGALFTARIVYESTFLTWQQGPQMLGYSMMHGALGIAGLLALYLGWLWAPVVTLVAALRRTWPSKPQLVLIAVVALSFGLLSVSYGHWKLLTVKVCGTERVTRSWLFEAAAHGEKPLLRYLIARGFDINTRNSGGESLLTIAKRTGQTSTSEWLIANGARE
jgi:hypothetical protein